ncbi:hypothetical protein P691DRAFT_784032 [Macrolepiota fuliginosa MF-IS2]|uniref:DUF5648 domain-containing protein n=1 Tax=Macrolepiota fuliginosa MF-IS2 TaxID=1400762 RepID=A0A9P5X836_9AGAR|nr:hypothetical protein P691DRAFT_784032 [Macrolepiota fuliginosa MF-IS2]
MRFSTSASPWPLSPLAPKANCTPASEAVPLLRLWNPTISDHFYTTSFAEANSFINGGGYVRERDTGRIFTKQFPGTVPFYRLYDPDITDHYYTSTDPLNPPGFHVETITGYVYPNSACGGIPLYRMWSSSVGDHFYTEISAELNSAEHAGQQYTLDHVDGYVLPA